MRTTIGKWVGILACLAAAGCGGGGDAGGGGSSGGTVGALNGPASNPSPCAPNLCVSFDYPTASVARLLTGSVTPGSTTALAGYSAHYSLTGGALPQGMTLDAATGAIHGTPTTNGFYDATVQLTVGGYSGSLSTHVSLEVLDPTLGFGHAPVPIGPQDVQFPAAVQFFVVGTPVKDASVSLGIPTSYGETMDANPSAASRVAYSVIGTQALPAGLSLDAATGAITGTPTQPGVWLVQVQAVAGGSTFTGWAPLTVGPVIDEHIGQPAAAAVQIPVHAASDTQFTMTWVQSVGNPFTDLRYDANAHIITVTPAAIPAGSIPGIAQGAEFYIVELAGGAEAVAGYVEQIE